MARSSASLARRESRTAHARTEPIARIDPMETALLMRRRVRRRIAGYLMSRTASGFAFSSGRNAMASRKFGVG